MRDSVVWFHTRCFLWGGGGGDIDACKGCMHVSDIFKDKNHHNTKPKIMLYFVIVLYTL